VSTPLLQTKLYIPPIRSALISRPRLIERLDSGLGPGCKLTLLSAPAGYGKTTLLGEWVHAEDKSKEYRVGSIKEGTPARNPTSYSLLPAPSFAWLSLDEEDNDPSRFWSYVVAALRAVRQDIEEVVQTAFQSPRPPPIEAVLTGLLNQIAQDPHPLVLVLDDYHVIHSSAIHQSLAFLLEHLPSHAHLAIATRADPPLPIPRLRGRGQLIELYQADLRFTPSETARFLNQAIGLELSAQDVAALEKRTEGWIAALHLAALQMAALAMRGRDDLSEFVRAFAGDHRYVLDYLAEEVLRQQGRDVQTFLLHTAILERLSGELCDAVMGTVTGAGEPGEERSGMDSQSMLETLDRDNLFIVPLDDRRHWYRYHRLFADLLRQRLQRERSDWVPELHRRASKWYEENGLIPEAVSHALAAEDLERAAGLIEWAAWPILMRGEMTTVLGWLGALPPDFLRSRPQLGILQAWALAFAGEVDRVEPCLQDLEAQQVQGDVIAVRAYVATVRGDVSRAIELAHLALERLPGEKWFSRGIVALSLGLAYQTSGELAAASRALNEAISFSRAAGRAYMTLVAMTSLGRVQERQGLLCQAMRTYQEALDLTSGPGSQPAPFAGMPQVGIAEVLYEWNDLDGALRHVTDGIRLSERGGFAIYMLAGHTILARVHWARGQVEEALEGIRKAGQLAAKHDYAYLTAVAAGLQSRLWLARGNLAAASRWAQEHRWNLSDGLDSAREVEQISVARVLIAQASSQGPSSRLAPRPSDSPRISAERAWRDSAPENEFGEAMGLLARLLEAAERAERMESAIKILALLALAFQAQGNVDRALSTLERALSLAEPEGYVRTFIDEGEPMAALLRRALAQSADAARPFAPNYATRLLAAFGRPAASAPPGLVEPLSEREMDVLRLVVAGLSNPQIAEELVIAVSTVKSHINHLYGKLGVSSRAQAIARAQALHLL
jgi:LuxR family maltose regulon positive regulatory protein